jgi:D-alanine-D-alanine ligase-like ATP-grasp enzyme
VLDATFRLDPADPTRSRRGSTRSATGARRTSRSACRRRAASSGTRRRLGRRLIEAAGLKGTRIGGAVVSEKHANFIVNDQKGTATDVRRLAERVRPRSGRRRVDSVRDRVRRRLAGWEAAGMSATETPVVVLLGGPSAEHDVSIVSGTAIAEALADGRRGRAGPDRSRRGWWWLPAGHRARRTGRRATTTRRARRDGPVSVGAAIDRLADPSRHRSSSSPCTAVRRGRHGPGAARGGGPRLHGSGVAASAIGMDKTLFKRICRGIGCRSSTGARSARRWASDPDAVRAELEAFAAGDRRPAADGQAGAARQLGRDDPRPRPVRADAALGPGLPARHAGARRELRRRRARPRGRDHRQRPGALELYGPGEIVSGHEFYDYAAKYTAGLSETSTRAEVSDRERATILKIARDAYRAIGAEGFARVDFLLAGDDDPAPRSTRSRVHADQPLPDDAGRGGYTFGASAPDRRAAVERPAAAGPADRPADLPR